MLGGTRFIGVYLARDLVAAGHEVTLLTRGKAPITQKLVTESDADYTAYKGAIKHVAADRKDYDGLKAKLSSMPFDGRRKGGWEGGGVGAESCWGRRENPQPHFPSLFPKVVYDLNGREAEEAVPILDALPNLEQYIFCSSAGVYKKTEQPPHYEHDAGDPKSRHKGKLDTEALLASRGVNYTSVRPVYIYGPLNYNPVEEWFFHRVKAGRPIPVPGSGLQVTQLGHVGDLASAFHAVLGNAKAKNQIYNVSGERFVTFDGIARACAAAAGAPEPELIHYEPAEFDFGKAKAFPLRSQHFFTSIEKAKADLGWAPKYGLLDGLTHSYANDFGLGNFRK